MAEENDIKAVFKKAVNDRLTLHPNQWAGEDSAETVRRLVTSVKDDSGTLIELTPEEEDVIQVASRPTQEVQIRVVRAIIERHNAKVDAETEKLLRRVVSAASFKMELVKAGKIKDSAAGELSDILG